MLSFLLMLLLIRIIWIDLVQQQRTGRIRSGTFQRKLVLFEDCVIDTSLYSATQNKFIQDNLGIVESQDRNKITLSESVSQLPLVFKELPSGKFSVGFGWEQGGFDLNYNLNH